MSTPSEPSPDAGVVDLTFRRLLPAPPAKVWAAWTRAEEFPRWFGPHGSGMDPCEIDPRVGGRLFFCHRHPAMDPVWVRGEFVAFEPPHHLAIVFGFAGPDGAPAARDGFADASRIDVVLNPHADGTEMLIRHTGLASDQGESEGWRQSLERLDAFLA